MCIFKKQVINSTHNNITFFFLGKKKSRKECREWEVRGHACPPAPDRGVFDSLSQSLAPGALTDFKMHSLLCGSELSEQRRELSSLLLWSESSDESSSALGRESLPFTEQWGASSLPFFVPSDDSSTRKEVGASDQGVGTAHWLYSKEAPGEHKPTIALQCHALGRGWWGL